MAAAGGGAGLNKDSMQFWVDRVVGGGDPPPLGLGSKQLRTQFLNAVGDRAKELGISGADSLVAKAGFKADSNALSALSRLESQVLSFEGTALKNLDVAMGEARKYARTGVPIVDAAGNVIRRALGDRDIPALQTALTTVRNEYAKVSASATAAGQVGTRADREEIDKLLSSNLNLQQLERVADIMKRDMENRRTAMSDERNIIKKRIGSNLPGQSSAGQQRAPQEAIDYLKSHPELKSQFSAKYGYLPAGM